MPRATPRNRADYPAFEAIQTRWNDNDQYGHIYNATYFELFDSAMNIWMMARGMLGPHGDGPLAVVVENNCVFFRQVAFPDPVRIGLRLGHLGRSSAVLEMGLFSADDDEESAQARFVLVCVDKADRRPVPFPEEQRQALSLLSAQP
ncbi:acyl-CoA thioesterase [Paracoccus tegillarcae]|uniref:Thioesterase n=1 Tax=Paracoccus tegillarcae TaxID=1529068 RepID=A0A2K9F3H6_9RHOB|nr:thioesterase family protein [Paracoccus tegillarcae]AUH34932.1 thioesterase [Paracoccus tegillarcae]